MPPALIPFSILGEGVSLISVISLISAAILILLDQFSKLWAVAQLKDGTVMPVIEGVFEFRYTENHGVAFSMLQGQRWLFIPLTILVALVIMIVMFRSPLRKRLLFSTTCVLIFSGAVGNLIDRITYGYVIDFLYFRLIDFPIFNFADCCVVVGSVLMFLFVLFGMKGEEDTPLRTLFFGISVKKEKKDG